MHRVLPIKSLEDTTLWKLLNGETFFESERKLARSLATVLVPICEEASNRMKAMPTLHPQYTLHDDTHLLRVTELMAKMMPKSVIDQLNPVEIALLILSAHLHDQGMVLDNDEIVRLDKDPHFKLSRDTWIIEHPNLREVMEQLEDKNLNEDDKNQCRRVERELEAAMLSDYVRLSHGERAERFVHSHYGNDNRLTVAGINLSDLVGKLCVSHTEHATTLVPSNGYRYDERIGQYPVNMAYLALILRLADILDLDRDRTPDVLYRTIHFTSEVSLQEWAKHRSIEGWVISPEQIQFTARCEHPIYERTIRQFMDLIDNELTAVHDVVRGFTFDASRYKLDIPSRVDRSRIEPKNKAYIYHELEFSLSRDEIVKLLMTDELYQSPSLCVRELLQNSMDALRYRKALFKRDTGMDWSDGKVVVEHTLDKHGYEVVRCTDNGVGMDESVVTRYLTSAGRSYYRSPEFEQERISLRSAEADFDPCSQFGIGFMSCFMLGDRIVIKTRRDYGYKRGIGEPLVIEINGLGGLIVIREGADDQEPGTIVEITGRKKTDLFDSWDDKVRLVAVVDSYCLACEFPVEAICSIPEIAEKVVIPPTIACPKTIIEKVGIQRCITIEQPFSAVHPDLNGCIRASFLLDDNDHLSIKNDEAYWRSGAKNDGPVIHLEHGNMKSIDRYASDLWGGRTCLDGILVCGNPGRGEENRLRSVWANAIHLGNDPFTLDVRGASKPPLSPARKPPGDMFNRRGPRWDKLQQLAELAYGKLWEQIAEKTYLEKSYELFWQLSTIHSFHASLMSAGAIWAYIYVPLLLGPSDDSVAWHPLSSLGPLRVNLVDGSETLELVDSKKDILVRTPKSVRQFARDSHGANPDNYIFSTVVGMSAVGLSSSEPLLFLRPPSDPTESPNQRHIGRMLGRRLIPYESALSNTISVQMPLESANLHHPLVKLAHQARFKAAKSRLEEFAEAATFCLSNKDTFHAIANSRSLTRQMRWMAHHFKSVDWASVPSDLHPPYTIWLADRGSVLIAPEEFEAWAKSRIEDD